MVEQKLEPTEPPKTDAKPTYSKVPSYFELYANNVAFETNVWDLNVIFALLDQDQAAPPFKRLGSVHIPWAQAKIMAYFLLVNIAWHELAQGQIPVPSSVKPTPFDEYAKQNLPDNETTKALVERIARIRTELSL